MRFLRGLSLVLLLLGISNLLFAQIGCRVPGTNTIYPLSNTYVLGVVEVNGVAISLPATIYLAQSPISTTVSCTVPHLKTAVLASPSTCYYGNPVSLGSLLVICSDCKIGERVQYTTTLECNLDDYSWLFGASAAAVGLIVIRRRKF